MTFDTIMLYTSSLKTVSIAWHSNSEVTRGIAWPEIRFVGFASRFGPKQAVGVGISASKLEIWP